MSVAATSARPVPGDDREIVARVAGATKRYPGVVALDRVDFSIRAGEVRALLGKNGAGKSTLIRLLTGAEAPDEGRVEICGRPLAASGPARTREAAQLGVRAVYQELSLVPGMSIAENMFLGVWPRSQAGVLDHALMARETREALGLLGLELDPHRHVGTLSPAQRQMVEIARALMGRPRLVILDEPTSSLAAAEVEAVFRAVRRVSAAGVAILYVSHRMKEIREIAATATVMRDGRITSTVPVAEADTGEIVRMMLGHDEHRDQMVEARVSDTAPVVLAVRGLAVPPKLVDVSFELRRGEVLGIAGLLGSGRTELLRAVAGIDTAAAGEIRLDGTPVRGGDWAAMLRRGLAYTPESRKEDGIFPLLGVDENIIVSDRSKVGHMGVLSWSRIAAAASAIIERMSIKTDRTATPIGTLSGGNQQKAVIGRWVYAGSRILLLDEPTRGVDVEAKTQIYAIIRALAAEGKSVIFVSSEVEELPNVCDRVLVLREGRFAEEFRAPGIDADRLLAACIAAH